MKMLPEAGPERRRALALLAILAALVAWVWWPAGPEPGVVTAAAPAAGVSPGGPSPVAANPLSALQLPEQVNMAALERTPGALAVGRNLFRFGARPVPPPPPPVDVPVNTAPPAPPPPTGPPPVPLRLTGRVESPDGRVVITLKDPSTGALFHASEGDVVDGRYRVIKVGVTSAVVAYLDGSGQRTVMLGGG